ncbi:MAG: thioredoxin-disulfide reductase [Dissulfurimicrobium sp.]|uniref:thioredoxin-disulfide reductase n=1 Tax=Dissulfurimicrobium TaxID=1769732 RepID=UPI001EDA6EA1|nr:thioredoxin-disulfide reductase [Dissulfurimicrobium hydrothermale]UKL13072.1 thioredoxin-disulfide reductase [Dissulfurimicrobium hydrothermale]
MSEPQLIIIGGGPAGMAAALYAGRAMINTLLIEKIAPGGQMLWTDKVDNYLGFPDGVLAYELVEKMAAHARRFGVKEMAGEVSNIESDEAHGCVHVKVGDKLFSPNAVIVATGASPRRLGVKGEAEFTGKGVSYCATCDAAFFKDQKVAVVGGGDTAVQEAVFLTRFASKVYIIHRRDRFRAVKILAQRALSDPKIEPIWNTIVEEIEGDSVVSALALRNKVTGEPKRLPVDGVFVFIGMDPNTGFVPDAAKKDGQGFLITDEWMRTSLPRVFAAGDCRSKPLRQIITAVGDGATAAFAAEQLIE